MQCEKMKTNELTARTRATAVALLGALAFLAATPVGAQTVRYEAQPAGSKVKMEGTSTIHDWSVESPIIGGFIEADADFPASALKDPKSARPTVEAFIPVRTLKSYSKKMDEVMLDHLNMAKHPRIEYRLIELKPRSAPGTTGALPFDAVGALTVAGVTRTNTMIVTIEKSADTHLKVAGAIPLRMTDFGVQPPAPQILGMPVIKTGDQIKISFEWLTAPRAEPIKRP